MRLSRFFVRKGKDGREGTYSERPMTEDEHADFDAAFTRMDDTFTAMDKLFENARKR